MWKEMNFTNEAQVWDLHIHTNKCPKGSDQFVKEYGDNTKGFIDELLSKFMVNDTNRVSLISFTDHNLISLEVYKEFYSRLSAINLIPGVEIDCLIRAGDKPKHIIVYFECNEDNIEDLSIKINKLLEETRTKKKHMILSEVLEQLVNIGYNFIVSPHAFKQGKRAIDFDWSDEEYTKKAAPKFVDQFFVFWEVSGYSTIQKAKEFLEKFELEDKVSIVAFSDANNFKKVDDYLINPPQYFNSLPTFRGLAMVGTDATRIRCIKTHFEDNRNPGMIHEVSFNGNTIYFAKQLNSIIGGRGSGKSLLLDAIANKLKKAKLVPKRKKFVEKFPVYIKNFNGNEIPDNFSIEYFDQAYVNELFSSDRYSENLANRFSETFSRLTSFNKESIESDNKSKFLSYIPKIVKKHHENLNSFSRKYPIIFDDGLSINIKGSDKKKVEDKNCEIDYTAESLRINKFFEEMPIQIRSSKNLERLKTIIKLSVFEEIHEYNKAFISKTKSLNSFIDLYLEAKKNRSDISKKKSELEKDIKITVDNLLTDFKIRNSLINAYFQMEQGFKSYYSDFLVEDGVEKNTFIFSKELTIETPTQYIIGIFNTYLDTRRCKATESNVVDICKMYILGTISERLTEKSTIDNITSDLYSFSLSYSFQNNMYYVDDGVIQDVTDLSPGTQTNIVMEYIVYRKTNKPLLIDQPEDNIDNKTIYNKLRVWFTKLKAERQVIVVTHDANIVINADAENVIIAEQPSPGNFKYTYGALEHGSILEEASSILDGGKEAVKRRLTKYES